MIYVGFATGYSSFFFCPCIGLFYVYIHLNVCGYFCVSSYEVSSFGVSSSTAFCLIYWGTFSHLNSKAHWLSWSSMAACLLKTEEPSSRHMRHNHSMFSCVLAIWMSVFMFAGQAVYSQSHGLAPALIFQYSINYYFQNAYSNNNSIFVVFNHHSQPNRIVKDPDY